MKLLPFLSLLFPLSAFAATLPSAQNVYQLGGNLTFPSVTVPYNDRSIITLTTGCAGAGPGAFMAFAKANSPSPTNAIYQVPGGKTFRAIGMYYGTTTGTASHFMLGYGTASFAHGTGTAPTGAVYYSPTGTNNSAAGGYGAPSLGTTAGEFWIPLNADFPASSYPFWTIDQLITCTGRVFGYEY